MTIPDRWQLVQVDGQYGLLTAANLFIPLGDVYAVNRAADALVTGMRRVRPGSEIPSQYDVLNLPGAAVFTRSTLTTAEAAALAQARYPDRYASAAIGRIADTIRQALRGGLIAGAQQSPTGRYQIPTLSLLAWLADTTAHRPGVKKRGESSPESESTC